MKRLFWLGLGVGIGVLVVRKVTKKAEAYTPKGLANAVSGLGDTFRAFAEDVREAMAEREDEMLDALGVNDDSAAGRHGRSA